MAQRVALVTGGMGGLGEAICVKLEKMGIKVVVTYSPGNTKHKEWLKEMEGQGHKFFAYPVRRVRLRFVPEGGRRRSRRRHGPIDILINNAGITRDMTFKKMTKVDWDAVIRTNLDSVFNVTKPVVDGMVERGWGRVINVSSRERPEGRVRPDQLLGGEGGHARLHQGAGARGREEGRHGEHDLAGLHRDQDGAGDPEGRARLEDHSADSRWDAWASPTRSPACAPISRRTRRHSSRAPTSPSTAASTCSRAAPARRTCAARRSPRGWSR